MQSCWISMKVRLVLLRLVWIDYFNNYINKLGLGFLFVPIWFPHLLILEYDVMINCDTKRQWNSKMFDWIWNTGLKKHITWQHKRNEAACWPKFFKQYGSNNMITAVVNGCNIHCLSRQNYSITWSSYKLWIFFVHSASKKLNNGIYLPNNPKDLIFLPLLPLCASTEKKYMKNAQSTAFNAKMKKNLWLLE